MAINCASIPEELLENELFGHKKGSYTDAHEDYIGKFGQANQGTIFLDEIGEMNYSLQAKLLRVIQFKEYELLGSSELKKIDVRIITATNKNILELIKQGKFREDLYYRLNVVRINIPPLRERKEDIELLAGFFLQKNESIKKISGFSDEALELLEKYNWPGNVRELENVIERAVALSSNNHIKLNDIALEDVYINCGEEKNRLKSLKEALFDFKKKYIIKALEKNNWNQTMTANILKIERTYLSKLIKELNIDKI